MRPETTAVKMCFLLTEASEFGVGCSRNRHILLESFNPEKAHHDNTNEIWLLTEGPHREDTVIAFSLVV